MKHPTPSDTSATIKVWDPLVRIFHWSLASFFFLAYLTEDWLSVHVYAGYAVALLVLFRLIWGVIGTRHARFGNFVTGPATVRQYLKDLFRGRAKRYIGHNPAGGAMIVLLLLFLILTALSGMATLAAEEGQGPLAGTFIATLDGHAMEEVHEVFANGTLLLVAFHIAGVIVSSLLHGENLVRAMITGRKARDLHSKGAKEKPEEGVHS